MAVSTRQCKGCGVEIDTWRSCGSMYDKKCRVDIGYCTSCGGEKRSIDEIVEHMKTHRSPAVAA